MLWHLDKFDPRTKPARGTCRLNRDHPLARSAALLHLFNEGAGAAIDILSGRPASLTSQAWGAGGIVATSSTSASICDTGQLSGFSAPAGTVAWRMKPEFSPTDSAQHFFWGMGSAGASPEFTAQKYLNNSWFAGWNNAAGDRRVVVAASTANLTQSVWQSYALTWNSAGSTLYRNGISIGVNAAATATTAVNASFGWGGGVSTLSPGMGTGSTIEYGMVMTASMSPAQVAWLATEPYAMLEPEPALRTYSFGSAINPFFFQRYIVGAA